MIPLEYEQKVLQWRSEREVSLRRENGWLALAGLFWLRHGQNQIGSDAANDVVLPPRLPASVGSIQYDGKGAILRVSPGTDVQVNGAPVQEARLRSDLEAEPSFITLDSIRMVVVDRPKGLGIRLWDNLRPERQHAPQREWFPINERLRVPAVYSRFSMPRKVLMPDVFGDMERGEMDGQVAFEIEGRPYTLQAADSEDDRLEIHFQDPTNGRETYPSGRYYLTQDPVVDGRVTLDFNFAYNPPCAFTDYATCVFAPPGNQLSLPIRAGEIYIKRY